MALPGQVKTYNCRGFNLLCAILWCMIFFFKCTSSAEILGNVFSPQIISLVMVSIGVYARMMKHAGNEYFTEKPYSLLCLLWDSWGIECQDTAFAFAFWFLCFYCLHQAAQWENWENRPLKQTSVNVSCKCLRRISLSFSKKERVEFVCISLWALLFSFLVVSEAALAYLSVDPAVMLMVVGVLMFIITFCGCVGSLRENICLLQTVGQLQDSNFICMDVFQRTFGCKDLQGNCAFRHGVLWT